MTTKITKKSSAIVLGVSAFVLFAIAISAHANPLQFLPTVQTDIATTTISYITPGTGTTTLVFDSFAGSQIKATDAATLLLQYTASSTAPVLDTRFEFSQDGIDWYPDNNPNYTAAVPGSTASTSIATTPYKVTSFTLSTTTDNGGSGTSGRVQASLNVPTPVRYTRAIFYAPVGGGNGALWAQIVPKRQGN